MNNWQITDEKITFLNDSVSFTMIKIPGGDFWLGETPVTQELWETIMSDNPSKFKGNPKNPVENVSCKMALEFIAKLNEQTSLCFRLPTVREWEFAAHGGSESKGYVFPGSNTLKEVCCYGADCHSTQPVKSKLPNEIGLYDMLGNVMEWTADEIETVYVDVRANTVPLPKKKHIERLLKGGSFMNGKYTNTIEFKKSFEPWYYNFHIGFRLALTPVFNSIPTDGDNHCDTALNVDVEPR